VSKSDLGYQLLAALNSGRLKVPGPDPPPPNRPLPPTPSRDEPPLPSIEARGGRPLPSAQGRDERPLPATQGRDEPQLASIEARGGGPMPPTAGQDGPRLPLGEGRGEGVLVTGRPGDATTADTPSAAPALAEFWRQARLARATLHANQRLQWFVDPREGHDDLLVALALAVEAARYSHPRIARGRRPSPAPGSR
jgi:hypothetical protein